MFPGMTEGERKRILETASELFMTHGIKSVSMDDLASELGISKKTIYQHVADKKDLVWCVFETGAEEKNHRIETEKKKTKNAVEELFIVNLMLNEMMQDHSPACERDLKKYYPDLYEIFYEQQKKAMYDAIKKNLQRGKKEGVYRENLNEEIIARLQVFLLEGMNQEEPDPKELHAGGFFNVIFDYHIRAIVNKKGLVIYEKLIQNIAKKQ
jgi:TetR/AcrR family transcriptional regulator, cholesterol catabolism regulator